MASGLREQLDLQLATLHDDTLPDLEIVGFPCLFSTAVTPGPGKSYASLLEVLNHPPSRGTAHAVTSNPQDDPEIDPKYFEKDAGLQICNSWCRL